MGTDGLTAAGGLTAVYRGAAERICPPVKRCLSFSGKGGVVGFGREWRGDFRERGAQSCRVFGDVLPTC